MSTLFSSVELAPRDPILGLTEAFNSDPRPGKVNLGVGVYTDEQGRIPLLECVSAAERARLQAPSARGYMPIEGPAAYASHVQRLLFGADSEAVASGRSVTAEALGGTGALRIGADLLKRISPQATVMISEPSWENHQALFEAAGFKVRSYPYYDPATHGLDFPAMLAALNQAETGTVVVLHACCHNPTGVDLDPAQWRQIVDCVRQRNLVPFLDIAYQGFGEGLETDSAAVRLVAAAGIDALVASSFSKSFSLYGERVGALTLLTGTRETAGRVLSQLKRAIRTNYSSPPTHGGALVAAVLGSAELRALWERELSAMRNRIRQMRDRLVDGLAQRRVATDFSFVRRQRGMFSYSGLTPGQVERLREQHAIYAIGTGRICVAALNSGNVDVVCDAIAAVLKS
ncbi:MAG TPA: amino acid aminotransferase [Burkholderiaceae bacterium]|jgi:aromatic-amino-acid transaminase|nr:amino acid aminotransferase [Burkholderiaceae bacterium]